MSDFGTGARHPMTEAFNVLTRELHDILDQITELPHQLKIEPEAFNWIVVDTARNSIVMVRHPDLGHVIRWAHAFVRDHPGATLDMQLLEGEPTADPGAATTRPVPQADTSEPASPSLTLAPVVSIHSRKVSA